VKKSGTAIIEFASPYSAVSGVQFMCGFKANLRVFSGCSDNFSFQNNGIKKVHMLENNGFLGKKQCFFFWKTMMFFLKAMFFDMTSHMIHFDYKAYAKKSCFT